MKEIHIDPSEVFARCDFFDSKVREMCESCKRYGKKATCPPHIEPMGYYMSIIPHFKNGVIYYEKFIIENDDWAVLGKESSLKIHNKILEERKKLFNSGYYFFVGFGAGSCKRCDQCIFPCRMPDEALIPFEAIGVNIIKLMRVFNVNLKFPVKKHFYRVGAIFYD